MSNKPAEMARALAIFRGMGAEACYVESGDYGYDYVRLIYRGDEIVLRGIWRDDKTAGIEALVTSLPSADNDTRSKPSIKALSK